MLTHHAYYIEDSLSLFSAYVNGIRLSEMYDAHDPDFHAHIFEKFGIADAQQLTQSAALRSVSGRALYMLGLASITSEAQQALLKLFEEPQQGSIFVLLLPHGTLLPTLRSRMLPYSEKLQPVGQKSSAASKAIVRQISDFLKADQKTRSAQIAALLKEEENQKERVRDFLNGLEARLAEHISEPQVRAGLEDIARVRSYVGDRSPSLKMLLEHLALSLPRL